MEAVSVLGRVDYPFTLFPDRLEVHKNNRSLLNNHHLKKDMLAQSETGILVYLDKCILAMSI